jgi:hypothetical protein
MYYGYGNIPFLTAYFIYRHFEKYMVHLKINKILIMQACNLKKNYSLFSFFYFLQQSAMHKIIMAAAVSLSLFL